MKHGKLPKLNRLLFLCAVVFLTGACKKEHSPVPQNDQSAFDAYWHQGKAEISSYTLNQSIYGSTHTGKAVLLFVTEDFSKLNFFKLNEPEKSKADAIKVLKFNMTKEFVAGIDKSSMMSSVFTPMDFKQYPHSLKLTASTLDWSGQSFSQTIWKGNRYNVEEFSNSEDQSDATFSLVNTWLEDEMWNKIRVAPHTLPIGEVKMIASAFYLRLAHKPNKVYVAKTTIIKSADRYTYTILYPELSRTMSIDFETEFPHKILGWKETYGLNEVTTGRLVSTMMSDFWKHHLKEDEALRDSLKLND